MGFSSTLPAPSLLALSHTPPKGVKLCMTFFALDLSANTEFYAARTGWAFQLLLLLLVFLVVVRLAGSIVFCSVWSAASL